MKTYVFALWVTFIFAESGLAQHAGGIVYSDNAGRARGQSEQAGVTKFLLSKEELPPSPTSSFIECNVMINVKADEYVVAFGIVHEAASLAECSSKMDATVKAFTEKLQKLGVSSSDQYVDFVAQNKIYGFETKGDILQEIVTGFELKKNILIHFTDLALLDKITLSAADLQIFDLIKVDYVIKDISSVHEKLLAEASKVAKSKVARYETLFGIKLQPPAQVYAEKTSVNYPTKMYQSYTAAESESVRDFTDRQRYTIRLARKNRTSFYNGLTADGFDSVINPVLTEPVVQVTLYLKLKYEVNQG